MAQKPDGIQQSHMIRNLLVRWYKRQIKKIREMVKRYTSIGCAYRHEDQSL